MLEGEESASLAREVATQLVPRWAGPRLFVLDAGAPMRVLSWALGYEGFSLARQVAWCEFRNDELGLEVDPLQLVRERLKQAEADGAVPLMTSAMVRRYGQVRLRVRNVEVEACATAGLGNAECVGESRGVLFGDVVLPKPLGTINLACFVFAPLTLGAQCEALSIAVEARTRAVLEANVPVAEGRFRATGTGTDCVALLVQEASEERAPAAFAGKHTVLGLAVGAACYRAVSLAIQNQSSLA
jgi:adenosylcobinamide amidohydrolase